MYTDEGELEFDEDDMAAHEGQCLVAELFPDSGSEPDFQGFHASEPAGNLSGGDDSGSEAVTESDDDEGITDRLSDVAAATAYRTNPNLPDFIHQHGPLIHASGSSAYEILEGLLDGYVGSNVLPGRHVGDSLALRLQGRNDHTLQQIPGTDSKGKGLIRDCAVCFNTPLAGSSKGAPHRSSYECGECKKALCIYPCFKRFHTLTVYKEECTDAFHSLLQVPVGSGVQKACPAAKHFRRH